MNMLKQIELLRELHRRDVVVFGKAHREWRNRLIHFCCIPIENLVTLLALLAFTDSSMGIHAMGAILAMLSIICCNSSRHIGLQAAVFHLFSGYIVTSVYQWVSGPLWAFLKAQVFKRLLKVSQEYIEIVDSIWTTKILTLLIASGAWLLAIALQVVVGHWVFEKNTPNNLDKRKEARLSSMSQPILLGVLMAWSS